MSNKKHLKDAKIGQFRHFFALLLAVSAQRWSVILLGCDERNCVIFLRRKSVKTLLAQTDTSDLSTFVGHFSYSPSIQLPLMLTRASLAAWSNWKIAGFFFVFGGGLELFMIKTGFCKSDAFFRNTFPNSPY
jgi:hypothetical protein